LEVGCFGAALEFSGFAAPLVRLDELFFGVMFSSAKAKDVRRPDSVREKRTSSSLKTSLSKKIGLRATTSRRPHRQHKHHCLRAHAHYPDATRDVNQDRM
jgi:hypothetical protein